MPIIKNIYAVLLLASLGAGCQKENSLTTVDIPPIVSPDTTIVPYFGNLILGDSPLPVDTIFVDVRFEYNNGSPQNIGYVLNALIELWPSFVLQWEPRSPDESGIQEGDYMGCCAFGIEENVAFQIQEWIISGQDPSQFPPIDPISNIDFFSAQDVNINISNVEKNFKIEVSGSDTLFLDKARVKLSGMLMDSMLVKPILGDFVCYFGRQQ
jgi:hypothetical protein